MVDKHNPKNNLSPEMEEDMYAEGFFIALQHDITGDHQFVVLTDPVSLVDIAEHASTFMIRNHAMMALAQLDLSHLEILPGSYLIVEHRKYNKAAFYAHWNTWRAQHNLPRIEYSLLLADISNKCGEIVNLAANGYLEEKELEGMKKDLEFIHGRYASLAAPRMKGH